ncbi:Uncharacterised protein [uncultured archaeon]|nr:Uncharacterised protein [uncultured archaeon]
MEDYCIQGTYLAGREEIPQAGIMEPRENDDEGNLQIKGYLCKEPPLNHKASQLEGRVIFSKKETILKFDLRDGWILDYFEVKKINKEEGLEGTYFGIWRNKEKSGMNIPTPAQEGAAYFIVKRIPEMRKIISNMKSL